MPKVISDLEARQIASEWHGGQASALYSLASCGAIRHDDVQREIDRELKMVRELDPFEAVNVSGPLAELGYYVSHHGGRESVSGWSELNW